MKLNETNAGAGTAANTEAASDRNKKANYDVIMGKILKRFQDDQKKAEAKKDGKFEGYTLNELNAIFGEKGTSGDKLKFTVIYAAVKKLIEAKGLFRTGAKKNEKFFLTEKEALANKPEPRAVTVTKKNQPYTLEKLETKKGAQVWTVIEGSKEKKEIVDGYNAAVLVPGAHFRVMDNSGEEAKLLMSNAPKSEQKPTTTAAAAAEETAAK